MTTYRLRAKPSIAVEALQFTGENRAETRAFVNKTIVIRQGKFFNGDGYITTGQWMIKDPDGSVRGITPERFEAMYVKDEDDDL